MLSKHLNAVVQIVTRSWWSGLLHDMFIHALNELLISQQESIDPTSLGLSVILAAAGQPE